MADITNSITMKFGYSGTDFTRSYKLEGINADALANVKTKILAYNANVPAADKNIFISDDYDNSDPENIIGTFKGIIEATIERKTETVIDLR